MKSLKQRLESVSHALKKSGSTACSLCGWYEGAIPQAVFTFVDRGKDAKDTPHDPSEDCCRGCGRPLVVRFEFDQRG